MVHPASASPTDDHRLLHASALAVASLALDYRRTTIGLRSMSRLHLAWLLAQRVLGATALVQTSQFLSSAVLQSYRRKSDLSIVRAEWAAAASTGIATVVGGAYGVHLMGGRPVLCAGFLIMPALYAVLSTRETLVLTRAAQPKVYEAAIVASSGLLPILILPPSLRLLLGMPIALPPLCAAWLDEQAGAAAASKEGARVDDMCASIALYHSGAVALPIRHQEASTGNLDCVGITGATSVAVAASTPAVMSVETSAMDAEAVEGGAEPTAISPQMSPEVITAETESTGNEEAASPSGQRQQLNDAGAARLLNTLSSGLSWSMEAHTRLWTRAANVSSHLVELVGTLGRSTGWVRIAPPLGVPPACELAECVGEERETWLNGRVMGLFSSGQAWLRWPRAQAPTTTARTDGDTKAEWWAREGWAQADAPSSSETAIVVPHADASTSAELVAACLRSCADHPPPHLDAIEMLPLWSTADDVLTRLTRAILDEINQCGESECGATRGLLGTLATPSFEQPAWLMGTVRTIFHGADLVVGGSVRGGRSFSEHADASADAPPAGVPTGLTLESAPMVFAALAVRPGIGCHLPLTARRAALTHLEGVCAAVSPLLAARTAPAHALRGDGADAGARGLAVAMRLGLLPTVASQEDCDIVEGLEPIFVAGHASPFYQMHVRWFRWFASGDAALLIVLLLVKAF